MSKNTKTIIGAGQVLTNESIKHDAVPLVMISQKDNGELFLITSTEALTPDILKEMFWIMLKAIENAPRVIAPATSLKIAK